MKRIIIAICLVAVTTNVAEAQNKKKTSKANEKEVASVETTVKKDDAYSKTANGLEYRILRDVDGKPAAIGDFIEVHIRTSISGTSTGDSLLFDSREMNNNQPVSYQIMPPSFKGDLPEGLALLSAGDSAVFRILVDSIPMGAQKPSWVREGTNQKLVYQVAMASVKSSEQMKKDQDEAAAKQKGIDDKIIQDYLAQNKVKAQKTSSGLYYKIDKAGTGEQATAGKTVTVNYTGKLLDGTTFDSNVDPQFQHVQPFSFALGQGQVIKGWDEGVALLKKGSKATLYIPSTLAYGAQGQGPIKPNSVLIFDVEVTDIK